jgi:hypothetical protein
MHKRRAEDPKEARKRKKGTTYSIATLDPPNGSKRPVENIRVWDVSTSEQTGRVLATRRIVMHQHKGAPDQPEEQTTGKGDEGGGEAHVEEAGTLADSESSPEMEKPPQRRQRAKKASKSKGNDSVSEPKHSHLFAPFAHSFPGHDGTMAPIPLSRPG